MVSTGHYSQTTNSTQAVTTTWRAQMTDYVDYLDRLADLQYYMKNVVSYTTDDEMRLQFAIALEVMRYLDITSTRWRHNFAEYMKMNDLPPTETPNATVLLQWMKERDIIPQELRDTVSDILKIRNINQKMEKM